MSFLGTNRQAMIWMCGMSVLGMAGCQAPGQPAPVLNTTPAQSAGTFSGPLRIVIARTFQPSARPLDALAQTQAPSQSAAHGTSGSVSTGAQSPRPAVNSGAPSVHVDDDQNDDDENESGAPAAGSGGNATPPPASTGPAAAAPVAAAPVPPASVPPLTPPVAPTPPAIPREGHVDMVDVIQGLQIKASSAINQATRYVNDRNSEAACASLAEVVGVSEMITRVRREIFPTETAWDSVFSTFMRKSQDTFVGYCSEESPHQYERAYYVTNVLADGADSLRVRITAILATLNAVIPVIENSADLDRHLVTTGTRASHYATAELLESGSSEAICHASQKTLGAIRAWSSVVFDNQNGMSFMTARPGLVVARWEEGVRGRLTDAYRLINLAVTGSCGNAGAEESRELLRQAALKLVEIQQFVAR